ncbi:DNA polymerase III delta subunit [Motilibacter peucedani]|uniref:DNA-directed DNA polymerase n=1 Tax=Motilibacter peucedani TaxID=598650 RepID=A0A420XNV3_9ACTN|nr:DNA polymerase III subunit delta [Motilibacter peucedani]RKS73879.1 DNA polymerase III delta subunit [Motilibacter peucedani]
MTPPAAPPSAPPAVTLVLGPDELLVERAVDAVVRRARDLDPGTELHTFQASELEGGTLAAAVSPSLFEERRVVVVHGLAEAGEAAVAEVLAALRDPADDVALVLTHRGGARGKKVVDAAKAVGAAVVACDEVRKRGDKLAFVRDEFRRAGGGSRSRIAEDAAEALLESVGGDLRSLAAACSQLASDVDGPVTLAAVRRYYDGRAEVSGFTVADAAVEGRTGDALVALRWALQTGTDPVLVTAAVAGALRSIVRVGSAGRGARAADVGLPPWKLETVRRQARAWSPEALAAAIREVARADVQVKGGEAEPGFAIERAVVAVARLRDAG